jgi:hypothetical protein
MPLDDPLAEAIRDPDPRARAAKLNAFMRELEQLSSAAMRARANTIRDLSASGVQGVEIARLFGLTKGRVAQILGEQRRRS